MKRQKLKEWTEEWVQYKKKYVKESTYATYLTLLENQILPRLGDVVIEDIDSQVIQEQVSYWCENGRIDKSGGLSQKTIKDMVTILKMCIRDYAKMNHYNVPVLEVEYPTSRQTQRKEILTKEQQDYLIGIIKNNLEYETLGYALLMYTGIRVGELCALQWADVNIERRAIKINKTLQRIYIKNTTGKGGKTKIVITTPKSAKSIRDIPISDALYELIIEKYCEDKEAYVITGIKKYMEPRLYRKHYEKFININKAEYIRFHGLRHTFATRCIESGADYKIVSELLGHSSVSLTLNLYVHPQWEDKKRCVELV